MTYNYPLLAQRDPRWVSHKLGRGNCTIGSDGCVITSVAMMLGKTPLEINSTLMQAGQFYGSSVYLATVPWRSLFNANYLGQSDWFGSAVPDKEMAKLRGHLMHEQPAIVCVDSTPAMVGVQYHYMLAVGVDGDGEIIVNDPWYAVSAPMHTIRRQWWKQAFTKLTKVRWGGVYGNTSADAIYRIDYFGVTHTQAWQTEQ